MKAAHSSPFIPHDPFGYSPVNNLQNVCIECTGGGGGDSTKEYAFSLQVVLCKKEPSKEQPHTEHLKEKLDGS